MAEATAKKKLGVLVSTGPEHANLAAAVGLSEAALARGYEYIAITEHSKALAMANGFDGARVSKSSRDPVVLVRQASWTVLHAKLEPRLVRAHERRSPVNLGAFRSRVYDET